jgi:alanine dehydrogenase
MRIGVAKEIKPDEHRVALTPAGARELAQKGHDVVVEQGAGEGSALADAAYEAVGARIASVDDVWGSCDLVLKVKEPLKSSSTGCEKASSSRTSTSPPRGALTRALDSGAICIAYETVETDDRQLPLLAPMAGGRLATQMGAWALEKLRRPRILLGGLPGCRR